MSNCSRFWSRPVVPLLAFLGVVLALIAVAPSQAFALLMFGAATPTTSLTETDPIMKVLANRPLFNNCVNESEFSDIITMNTEGISIDQTTGGRYIENAHRFSKASGYRGVQDGGHIPQAESPIFRNSRTYLRQTGYTLQMTKATMERVVGDEGSFVNYLEQELPEAARNIAHQDDRLLLGYGYDVRARVNGAVSGSAGATVVKLDSALGVAGWTDAWKMFDEGDQIVFTGSLSATIALRGAGSSQRGIVRDIDDVNNTITVETDATLHAAIADNDYIGTGDTADHNFPHGSGLTPMIPNGFMGGIDDGTVVGTYMNISRTGNRLWKGIVIDASAAPWAGAVTENLIVYAADETVQKGGGNGISALVASYSAERGLRNAFRGDRFFMDPRSYEGGRVPVYLRLGNRNVQLKMARKLPPQVMYGVDGETWTRHTMGTFEWDDTTGSIWNRVTDSTGPRASFYATGNKWDEFFCSHPRRNFRIQGLSVNQ